jgi:hypothetical protein
VLSVGWCCCFLSFCARFIKHPLKRRWTLWFDTPAQRRANPQADYMDSLIKVRAST